VTRYEQKYINQISSVIADTVPALDPNNPYPAYVYQNQNMGDVQNTGWETKGTLNVGAVTLNGTYSWTRSRITRLAPSYVGTLSVGDAFENVTEHTGAFTASYAAGATTFSLTANIVGQIATERPINGSLSQDTYRLGLMYVPHMTDNDLTTPVFLVSPSMELSLNAARTISRNVTLFLNVMNANNHYQNEGGYDQTTTPVMGRQTFLGARLRM